MWKDGNVERAWAILKEAMAIKTGDGNMERDYYLAKEQTTSNPDYNPNEVRYVMELDLGLSNFEKACAIAKKHGKEEEFRSKTEDYRGDYTRENLTSVLDNICLEKEYWGKESPKHVDTIVDNALQEATSSKPNYVRVAVKGSLNLARKTHLNQWYYPLVGMLPAKYQGKIAEKLGDKPEHYTRSNVIAEGVLAGATVGYLVYQWNADLGLALFAGGIIGLAGGTINAIIRHVTFEESKEVQAAGSITFLPYYATLYSIVAVKALKNAVVNAYSSALAEEQKLLQAKAEEVKLRIKPAPDKELARIEQPEEVDDDSPPESIRTKTLREFGRKD